MSSYFIRKNSTVVAKAEQHLFNVLQKRGLTTFLKTQHRIHFKGNGYHEPRGTIPDFYWSYQNIEYCVYLDGPHHKKLRQTNKDEAIDKELRKEGYTVERYRYKPPITKKRLTEIMEQIEGFLVDHQYYLYVEPLMMKVNS